MTTFADDETSIQGGAPREGVEIITTLVTYRISTSELDVTIGGYRYTANPASRGEIVIPPSGSIGSIEISIPILHPAVRRYLANGIPPQQAITINVWRQQAGGSARMEWTGLWTSCAADRHVAKIQAQTRGGIAMQRRIPTVTVGRECSHVLYDARCTIVRGGSYVISSTVASFDGATMTVASISAKPDQFFQFGELLHVASGSRVTIGSQVGTSLSLQVPIPELVDGDAVQLFAGCGHTIDICASSKFNNVPNYGGLPELPSNNPFAPAGYGAVSQT